MINIGLTNIFQLVKKKLQKGELSPVNRLFLKSLVIKTKFSCIYSAETNKTMEQKSAVSDQSLYIQTIFVNLVREAIRQWNKRDQYLIGHSICKPGDKLLDFSRKFWIKIVMIPYFILGQLYLQTDSILLHTEYMQIKSN